MSVSELSKYIEVTRYARYLKSEKRRETWEEMVDRMMDMHLVKYKHIPDVHPYIEEVREAVKDKLILGSQRALQFGGEGILKKHERIYNCTSSYCDRLRFFQEAFYLLLCGCGTGFSVQKHHVDKLPLIWPTKPDSRRVIDFNIVDTIEGWADALGVLMCSYMDITSPYFGHEINFKYHLIRPKGAPLSTSSGKAPGPAPLKRALENINALLTRCKESGQEKLRPIDAYDIVMYASDAVLSGGVRRSATIVIFSPDDYEMATAKTGTWLQDNPQRGRSNNSALLLRNKTTFEDFQALIQHTKQYGEPGFYWSDSTEQVPNPCCEIGFWPVEPSTGLTGWHFCNLSEINGEKCKDEKTFYKACRVASILGTLQAGYNVFGYLGATSENIVRLEALLGVSITGLNDNPDVLFDPMVQEEGARIVLNTNEIVASIIGINPTARATCIKPSGTASCLLGTSSGIHPHHARRYLRNVQSNTMEPPYQHFKKTNPQAVEMSVWDRQGNTAMLTFCIEVEPKARTKNQLSAIDMLRNVQSTYLHWVLPGTVKKRCLKPWLTHNVSNTIHVKEDEWDDVTEFIYNNRHCFAGISIMPINGDKDYAQSPFQAIYVPTQMVKEYGDGVMFASGLIEQALAIEGDLWMPCDVLLGNRNWEDCVKDGFFFAEDKDKIDAWMARCHRFSDRYFDGDLRKVTYMLKDVHNWKKWLDLKREYKPVDYVLMVEEEDNTKLEQEAACAGGSCTLI